MQTVRSTSVEGTHLENEVLTVSDEERKSLLQKAGISNIAIGSAEVLAIKAGMAIPWNRMRLRRQ